MYYKGESGGFAFWRYDMAMDENTWMLILGFGGPARTAPRPGFLDPLYRFQFRAEWRPLATCFEWWCEFLGVERDRGVAGAGVLENDGPIGA